MLPAYEREPELRQLDVEVLRAGVDDRGPYAVLDDTILYPGGGGQPPDSGVLAGVEVIDVQRVDEEVRHYVTTAVAAGPALLQLDWERRFDHMQQHTAQHLISAIAAERFGWRTTAFHMGADRCDVELDVESLDAAELGQLEEAVAAAIREARAIRCRRVVPEKLAELDVRTRGLPAGHAGDVRLVQIEGIDLNTCGGTHLRSTAQIECVKLLDTEALRGGTRLHWLAGRRVRARLRDRESQAYALRSLLGAGDAEMVETVAAKAARVVELERRARALERRLAEHALRDLVAGPDTVVAAHYADAELAFLQQVGRAFVGEAGSRVALLTAGEGRAGFFLLAAGADLELDLKKAGGMVAEILQGRGGGARGIFQGKADDLRRRDEAAQRLRQLFA